jgi:acetolactate synthase-1/2/3 large subunit
VIKALERSVPDDAVTCDAGENRLFMQHYFRTERAWSICSRQPSAGYAIPAALAAKLLYPHRAVVAVCGDGGFGIAMNGLLTAIESGSRS